MCASIAHLLALGRVILEIEWKFSDNDIASVQELVRLQADAPLVKERFTVNLGGTKELVGRDLFWFHMIWALLTSSQRSDQNSHVSRFMQTEPFPLSYPAVCSADRPENFMHDVFKGAGGIRFNQKIPKQLTRNLVCLQSGEWTEALRQCNRLVKPVPNSVEKEVASYIDDQFVGFGPKQSRSFLQALGLTRYEIPIDRHVARYLHDMGFPILASLSALSNCAVYEFMSDGIQMLCAKSDVYPCIFDAAVLSQQWA